MKNSKLGLALVALAGILFVFLIFLLTGKPHVFTREIPLRAFLPNSAGLGEGNAVRVNGIAAGRVTRVSLSGDPDPQHAIRIDFVVDRSMGKQVPVDSVASIQSDSALSAGAFLQINKGRSPKTIQPGDVLRALTTPQLNQLVAQGYTLLDASQTILNDASDIVARVEAGKGTAGKLLENQVFHASLQSTSNQMQKLGNSLDARLTKLQQIQKSVEGVGTSVNGLYQGFENGEGSSGMLLKNSKLRADANEGMAQWNTFYARTKAGNGTVARLMPQGEVGKQLATTLGNAEMTMDKVNAGQGTVGQVLVNPTLHDSIDGTTREFQQIMKDFRANPKRFFRIHVQIF